MSRDLRDPSVLGHVLFGERLHGANPQRLLSEVYDQMPAYFERIPDWTGDGFMSSNPALHHSKVIQDFGKERIDYDG